MKSNSRFLLAVLLFASYGTLIARSQAQPAPQPNFTLSPSTRPGWIMLSAPSEPGRVYFFQMSANASTWAYAPTVKLGAVGTSLEYEVFPTAG